MSTLLIINPISGTRSKDHVAQAATQALRHTHPQLHIATTNGPGHATQLAAQAAAQGYDTVIAAGGDGTINETARALIGTNTALAILPLGSGNGLARHLHISTDLHHALHTIATGHTITADHCTVNSHPYFCTFGMGFDAAVSDRYAADPTRRGLTAYVRAALHQIRHYTPDTYTITLPNQPPITLPAFIIACCNASQYGNNAYIAPQASITDGLLDLTLIAPAPLPSILHTGLRIITRTLRHNPPRTHTLRTTDLTITRTHPGPAHIDGEPITLPTTLHIACHPHTLRIITPPKNDRREKRR